MFDGKCFYCSVRERSKAPLLRHIQDQHPNKFTTFASIREIFRREVRQHQVTQIEEQETPKNKTRNSGQTTQNKQSLPLLHLIRKPTSPSQTGSQCTLADMTDSRNTSVRSGKKKDPLSQAPQPEKRIKRTPKVQAEMNKKRYRCPLCPSTFSSNNALQLHTEFYCESRPQEKKQQNLRPSLPTSTSSFSRPGPASRKKTCSSSGLRLRVRTLERSSSCSSGSSTGASKSDEINLISSVRGVTVTVPQMFQDTLVTCLRADRYKKVAALLDNK